MNLTPKQEAFCVAYLESGNATDAYRRSYNAAGMAPATVNRKAKEVLDNGKIAARVAALRQPVIEAASMTMEGHLQTLKELRDAAKAEGKFSAAVAAEMARGKVSGFYVDRVAGADGGALQTVTRIELVAPT